MSKLRQAGDCSLDKQKEDIATHLKQLPESELNDTIDGYAALITDLENEAKQHKEEAKNLEKKANELKKSAETKRQRAKEIKEQLMEFLQSKKRKKLKTLRYELSLVRNGGKRPVILREEIVATNLPKEYQRVSVTPDRTAIRRDLEKGKQLEYAYLGERNFRVQIVTSNKS